MYHVNKGYEIAYLNPIIFYRPVEFSKQSNKANALMGVNLRVTSKYLVFYGQFLLDDLNVSRHKSSNDSYSGGFFQNKYGYQIGLKGTLKDVDFLVEYNQVQPYTYGHRTVLQNYAHMNQALAHPLGANFRELINLFQMKKGKWIYKLKSIVSSVGLDSLDTHYGQNIFASDYQATTGGQDSYGNFNGQGVRTTILSCQAEISYAFSHFDIFSSFYYRYMNSDILDYNKSYYSIGIRTFPFSSFEDY